MKIVIDCFKLVKGKGKSIGIYNVAHSIVKCLINYNNFSETNNGYPEIYVLGNKYNKEDFDIPGIHFIEVTRYNPMNRVHCLIWELIGVALVCKRIKADRVIYPRGFCALIHPVKDIVIIHDLIPFYYNEKYPKVFNKIENQYIMQRIKQSARAAYKIITISESSQNDIIKRCGVTPEKIIVIHNICEKINYKKTDTVQNKTKYISAITSTLPHKNAEGILASYKKYCEITENPLNLIIIGIDNEVTINLPEKVRNKITCFKYIKEEQKLYNLIGNSSVFLFLSRIEGFGLPPIEAMQLNIPVICSNVSSLPEVTGNAAILVNPENPIQIANAIKELANNEKKQQELIARGQKNVERFSAASRAGLYWKAILD